MSIQRIESINLLDSPLVSAFISDKSYDSSPTSLLFSSTFDFHFASVSMDYEQWGLVTQLNWDAHLPHILRDMSECTFVALDFEFSGIPSHQAVAARRQTLQERYAECKAAAEKFQILQVGLTFAMECPSTGESVVIFHNCRF